MARRVQEEELRKQAGVDSSSDGLKKFSAIKVLARVDLDSHLGGVFSLQYNFDGTKLAAGFNGGGIRLYDPRTGEAIRDLRPNRHGGYAVMCLRFHPSDPNLLYAGTAEGHVYLYNVETGDNSHIITEPKGQQINTMDFCLDGFSFCTCGKDLTVRVYNTKTNKLDKEYEGYGSNKVMEADRQDLESGNTMRVYALKFHPDNENIFVTGGWDNHLKIWDLRTNDGIKRQIHGPHVCGDAVDMKGRNILSGSWCANHALQEWDYMEGKLVREINFPHKNGAFLYCAQYADLGVVLAGGSGTNSVEAVEMGTNRHLGGVQMTKPVQALDSALGGRLFAVGGGDSVINFCSLV